MRALLLWLSRRMLRRPALVPDYPTIARLESATGVPDTLRTVPKWRQLQGRKER